MMRATPPRRFDDLIRFLDYARCTLMLYDMSYYARSHIGIAGHFL